MRISRTLCNEDVGAMTRRLAQLAEEARPVRHAPKPRSVSESNGESIESIERTTKAEDIKENHIGHDHKDHKKDYNQFEELYNALKLEDSKFNYKHQRELAYTKVPEYAPIQSQKLALNRPWTGQESPEDITRRLLADKQQFNNTKQPLNPLQPLKPKKVVPTGERLLKARESTLDYKLNKHVGPPPTATTAENNDPMFSQLYKDRFLMGSGNSVISAMQSLASQRIEDAIARNEFKDLPRGQPQKKDYYASSPFIDTTEYFLNKMIQRQGASPPWVEKQSRVNTLIARNRESLTASWVSYSVGKLLEMHRHIKSADEIVRQAVNKLQVVQKQHSKAWEDENRVYHEELIKDTNSTIRGYNLQAPGSARKPYVSLERELEICYSDALERIPLALKKHLLVEDVPEAADKGALYKAQSLLVEDPSKHYGLGDLLRDLLRRRKRRAE